MASRKISISMEENMISDIDYLSGRLGISRSSLVSQLLGDGLSTAVVLMRSVPEDPSELSPDQVKRLRGQSRDIVRAKVENLRSMNEDLFNGI